MSTGPLTGYATEYRKALGESTWGENFKGIPGGRDIGQEFVQKYYAKAKDIGNIQRMYILCRFSRIA